MLKTLQRLLRYMTPYMGYFFGALLFSIINIIFTLLTPILIGQAIDVMIGVNQVQFSKLYMIILKIIGTVLLTALSYYLLSLFSNKMTYHISKDLRDDLFEKYNTLPLSYIDKTPQGDMMNTMTSDIELISDGLLQGFNNLFRGLTTIIGTIIFMISLNLEIALVVICLTPLSFIVSSVIAKKTYKYTKVQLSDRGNLSSYSEEMIGQQKLINAYSYEETNKERFKVCNDKMLKSGIQSMFLSALVNPTTRFVNALVYASVCTYGALCVVSGKITVGLLSSFLTYANQYTKPFNDISNVFTELQTAIACAQRVFTVIDEPSIKEVENPKVITHPVGHIDIDHISFSYMKERPLIEDFNLNVKPGQTIAIAGPTGCGKTTLINLLMRFYDPYKGSISIDHINTLEMNRNDVRHLYGMVLQDTWLFKGTIRENIAYGSEHASEEEIINAAKKAHAHKFIMQLKHGYDSLLVEEGANLSTGQRQLLCIARIMLADPPMLILDEATSSIDTRTEKQIQHAFDTMMEGRTTFIVAHRLSTIQKADKIIVMKDGHILEQGNHQTLLKKQGFYHKLYYSQFEVNE